MKRTALLSALTALAVFGPLSCGARDIGEISESAGSGGIGATAGSGGFSAGSGTGATGGFSGTGGFAGFAGTGGFAGFAGFAGQGAAAGFAGFAGQGAAAGFAGFAGQGAAAGFAGFAGQGAAAGFAGFGGQGGTGGGVVEDCLNGVDDDNDGFVDCSDSDCTAGYRCAAPTPLGWTGPLALAVGSGTPPACGASGGYPKQAGQGNAGPNALPALCSGCKCSSPQGVVCPTAALRFAPDSGCGTLSGPLTVPANICQAFLLTSLQARSVSWAESDPQGGACVPSLNSPPVVPPLTWKETARACGSPEKGAGCFVGACVPRPKAPYLSNLCIARNGDLACPPGPYNKRRVYFQSALDTRTCSGCSCGSPSGASCSGSVVLGTDFSCQSETVTLNAPGDCEPLPADSTPPSPPYSESRSVRFSTTGPVGGSCSASGGQTTGSVTPTNPVTVCCQ